MKDVYNKEMNKDWLLDKLKSLKIGTSKYEIIDLFDVLQQENTKLK